MSNYLLHLRSIQRRNADDEIRSVSKPAKHMVAYPHRDNLQIQTAGDGLKGLSKLVSGLQHLFGKHPR